MSGDCPNCLVQVDGETGVRCCTRPAADGMKVEPQNVMFSLERDPLAMNDMKLAHKFLPVGFYYKTLIKPRWLWPRVEPLIRKVAGLGKVDMSDRPRHLERVYRHPDVVVLGGGPAGLAAALGAAEAGASVIVADEGEHPGSRLGKGATLDAVRDLLAQVEANEQHRAAARAPRVRALRGARGAADRPRPARHDAAEGDRRRDRRVRVDGGLPRQRRARRDAHARRGAAGDAARDQARQRRRDPRRHARGARAHRRAAGGRHRGRRGDHPRRRRQRPRAAGRRAPDRRRDRPGARQEARQGGERALHRRHREDRLRPALPLGQPHAAGEPAAPGHGHAGARRRRPARPRARGRIRRPCARGRRARRARRGRRAARAGPEGAPLRRRRLRLHLRGRLRAGRAQRRDRGLLLDGAAQALHDDHDGPLPGPHVPWPDAHARRAPLARRRAPHLLDDDRPPAGARRHARRGHRRRLRAPRAAHGAARRRTSGWAPRSCGPASGSASTTTARSSRSTARCARASASSTSARSASSASPGPTSWRSWSASTPTTSATSSRAGCATACCSTSTA